MDSNRRITTYNTTLTHPTPATELIQLLGFLLCGNSKFETNNKTTIFPTLKTNHMRTYTYTVTTARFLSPDPYVQAPTNSQNYNRYSYCLNNPLKYTDPSGCITQLQMQINEIISGSKYDEYNGGGGYGGGGGRAGYSYNYTNGCYYDNYTGRRVDYSEVHNNYIKPNSTKVDVDYCKSYSVKESNGGYAYGKGDYVGCTYGKTDNSMLSVVYNNNGNVVASCIYDGGTSVVAKRSNSLSSLASVGMVNNMTNSAANSINRNAPNARYGSNGKVYWNGKFYGNQYVATKAISTISRPVANGTGILGVGISMGQVVVSRYNEGYWGPQTQATAASAVGGMAGGSLGLWAGAEVGAAIGGCFGGIGAIPGAVIGGFIGGVGGSIGGSLATEKAYEYYYGY